MVKGEHPTAFPLKHQQKDLRLVLELADSVSQPLPVAAAANSLFEQVGSGEVHWLRIAGGHALHTQSPPEACTYRLTACVRHDSETAKLTSVTFCRVWRLALGMQTSAQCWKRSSSRPDLCRGRTVLYNHALT